MFVPKAKPRPLFADDPTWQTPGIGDGIGARMSGIDPRTQAAVDRYADLPMQEQGKPSFGDRMGDVANALGAAQSFLDGNFSDGGQLLLASKARANEARKSIAAAQAAQLKRQQDWEDWQRQADYTRTHKAPDYGYEQDNAGNVHRYNKETGVFDPTPVFIDPNDKQYIQDGQLITVPNQYRSQQGGGSMPGLGVGTVVDDPRLWGGPSQPAAGNFPDNIPTGNPLDPWPPRNRR